MARERERETKRETKTERALYECMGWNL